jgi:stress-induced morphogen
MATITRGSTDSYVEKIRAVLDDYERKHPGAQAEVYRQNSAAIRIRIFDDNFASVSKGDRHDRVFNFLAAGLDDDTIQEISMLVPVTRSEKQSFISAEFDDPVSSAF